MGVKSVRVDDEKRKALKIIASMEDKTISSLVGDLIDEYLQKKGTVIKRRIEQDNLKALMNFQNQPSPNGIMGKTRFMTN